MKLEAQLEELLSAFQPIQQGKLPLGLLTLNQLHSILEKRNFIFTFGV